MFHSILHPPARIILKIHKSDYIIPFLRTFQWLPIRMKPKVLIKAFTAKGLLSATPPLSPTALPPSNTSAKYIPLNSLSSPNIFPPQAFELAVPFVWKVHFLRPPDEFLPVTEVSVQASSLQRHSPFHPICSSHPPLSVSSLSSHPCHQLCCFYSTHCSLTEKAMATHSSTLAWKIPWTEEPGNCSPWGR